MLFVKHVEDIAQYFSYAQENIEVDSQGYKTSFVNLHMLTYIVNHNVTTKQVSIKINFPLLPRVLKTYLHDTLMANRSNKVDITSYPAVRGYMLEMEFFKGGLNHLEVTILANDQPLPVLLNFPQVKHVDEVLNNITQNTLYHLRNDHPIIDGIGFVTNEIGEYWLVYIQFSITPYSNHDANLKTLLSEKKGSKNYKELAGDDAPPTLFEYYQNLASKIGALDKSRILYIYASTKTFYSNDASVFKQMLKH